MRRFWLRSISVALLLLAAAGAVADERVPRYDRRVDADFFGTNSREYEFELDERDTVVCPRCGRVTLHERIHDRLTNYHLYISNFLTHPNYGEEKQLAFGRGESLHPLDIRHEGGGRYSYRVRGYIDGHRNLTDLLKPTSPDCAPERPRAPPEGKGRFYICMPEDPDAKEIDASEWYDYTPRKFHRAHPTLKIRAPLGVLFWPRPGFPVTYPEYEELYKDGVLRIGLVFGFDEETHQSREDAIAVWRIITAPTSQIFRKDDRESRGYAGRGLGFSNPIGGDFRKLNSGGKWTVFARNGEDGTKKVKVAYRLSRPLTVDGEKIKEGEVLLAGEPVRRGGRVAAGQVIEREIAVEIHILNFDRRGTLTPEEIRRQFMELFKLSEVVHYDGHANYGGGFLLGMRTDDVLWADEIRRYARYAPPFYQIFSLGACHGSGYFADLFYNAFRGKKSTKTLDILAAVNETEYSDSVDDIMDLLLILTQLKKYRNPGHPHDGLPYDYQELLRALNHNREFTAFIGVFGSKDNPKEF